MSRKLAKLSQTRQDKILKRQALAERRVLLELAKWETEIGAGIIRKESASELLARLNSIHARLVKVLGSELQGMLDFGYKSAIDVKVKAIRQSILRPIIADKIEQLPSSLIPDKTAKLLKANRALSSAEFLAVASQVLFPPLPPRKVRSFLKQSIWGDTLTWEQRIAGLGRHANFRRIARDLTKGISDGENVSQLTRRLKPALDNVTFRARRIARTELGRVSELANQESSKPLVDAGLVTQKQVLAVLDERTRDHHVERHGRIYTMRPDGVFVADDNGDILPALPDEPNCRCFAIDVLLGAAPFETANARQREMDRRADIEAKKTLRRAGRAA